MYQFTISSLSATYTVGSDRTYQSAHEFVLIGLDDCFGFVALEELVSKLFEDSLDVSLLHQSEFDDIEQALVDLQDYDIVFFLNRVQVLEDDPDNHWKQVLERLIKNCSRF